jgi:neutral ceramidase
MMMKKIFGAVKSINITPPVGITMVGYERDHGAVGIKDDLFAKVLVLADEEKKVAIVTNDLAGIDNVLSGSIRSIVEDNTDLSIDSIMISASHTHSGPAVSVLNKSYNWMKIADNEADLAYYNYLKHSIANAIVWANKDLQPVQIGVGKGILKGLGSNRKDPTADYDSEVVVLLVTDLEKKPLSLLINYACHPTVLSPDNYLISGDYPSYMMRAVEKIFTGCEAMFLQGASADISTRHNRRASTFTEAERMGNLLAGEVIKIASSVETKSFVDIDYATERFYIPARNFGSDDECLKKLSQARGNLEKLKRAEAPENEVRTATVVLEGAECYYHLKKNLDVSGFETEMQIFRVGDLSIISVPAELSSDIGMSIKRFNCNKPMMIAGYTNDHVGYIVPADEYNKESYESWATMVAQEAEGTIIESAKKLISRVLIS